MRRPPFFTLIAILWLAIEIAAFALVVHLAGLSGAIALGLLTSVAGFGLLREIGFGAARHLRRAVEGEAALEGAMLDGTLAALASLLLILPGFASDLVGFGLAAPSIRQFLIARFSGKDARRGTSNGVVELTQGEWTRIEDQGEADRR